MTDREVFRDLPVAKSSPMLCSFILFFYECVCYMPFLSWRQKIPVISDSEKVSISPVSPEFGSPTSIFKLWEPFSSYGTMPFALEELKNGFSVFASFFGDRRSFYI